MSEERYQSEVESSPAAQPDGQADFSALFDDAAQLIEQGLFVLQASPTFSEQPQSSDRP